MKEYTLSELVEYYACKLHNPKLSQDSRERTESTLRELLDKQRILGILGDMP
jgi:hypothetical protein